jgi:hypothetical protein
MATRKPKIFCFTLISILLTAGNTPNFGQNSHEPNHDQITHALGTLPIQFIKNKGQLDRNARYYAQLPCGNVYFFSESIAFQFFFETDKEKAEEYRTKSMETGKSGEIREGNVLMSFVGVNKNATVEGLDKSETKMSFFKGDDSRMWVSGALAYQRILYRNIYPHIDLIVNGHGKGIKLEYRVKAGGRIEEIRVRYEGVKEIDVNCNGELEIDTGEIVLREEAPVSYQVVDGKRVRVDTMYVVEEDNTMRFKAGSYREDKELIIDPTLIFSTYLGGSGGEHGNGIAIDKGGNAYVTGWVWSTDFPATTGVYDDYYNWGYRDAFVAKINSSGSKLIFATFLGGGDWDEGRGISVDGDGNAYITGWTQSTNFPSTKDAFARKLNGARDAFVAKLNSAGTKLLFSTYLGGRAGDEGGAIVVDGEGNAYVAGWTYSYDFPTTPNAYDQDNDGGRDVFITKIDPTANTLLFSTYLGGSASEFIGEMDGYETGGIAIDSDENIYVTGWTGSVDFPVTANAYDTTPNGGHDVFVAKLNPVGTKILFSTYLGGKTDDESGGIAVDEDGNSYITGWTGSYNFPVTANAYNTSSRGGHDVFVTKLNPQGADLVYSTYLGGNGDDHGNAIAIDGDGNAYITGWTASPSFPAYPDAYDRRFNGDHDAFLARINPEGTGLLYSTYLGGSGGEHGNGITVQGKENVYVTGWTWSGDFPTTSGAYNTSYTFDRDVFISKIRFPLKYEYILELTSEDGGTTDPAPGTYKYHEVTEVTIEAIPDDEYFFAYWEVEGETSGSTNPMTVVMDSHKSIEAIFSGGGEWGDGGGGGGGWDMGPSCFIATAAYGSFLHPHVKVLREFRDRFLMPHKIGRSIVNFYNKYSPPVARFIAKYKAMKIPVRIGLLPLVSLSYSLLLFGPAATAAMLMFMVLFPILFVKISRRKKRIVEQE